ncbi:hypothetical protein P4E94_03870 [Pontiellaceae bacterium B12219]|nr:hypothetical protein [Pontiellaceae bacterium B12219]
MVLIQFRFWLGTLAVSLACSSMGAGLDSLKKKTEEKAAENQPEPSKVQSAASRSDVATSSFGSGTFPSQNTGHGNGFMGDFWSWMVAGPFAYRSDDPSASMTPEKGDWAAAAYGGLMWPKHRSGQQALAFVRADLNWQYVDRDNDAVDARIELGYKVLGFQARTTTYANSSADLSQRVNQFYGLLRYGLQYRDLFPGVIELAFGLGVATQRGDVSNDSSPALTFPVKYFPADWLGFEFRPAWYEADHAGIVYNIGDYDLSASLGPRFVQLRAGYRWLWYNSIGRFNDGPYIGVSLSY